MLVGGTTSDSPSGRLDDIRLRRDTAQMVVDRDPAAHLATVGITWHPHDAPALAAFGAGELVYLPPAYADDPDRRWPLVLFFHGSGDRGDNGLVLAQNSPFRFISAGGSLDAVVVAPLLAADFPSFPEAYLDGVLDDALARFRVDPAQVAVTGLSMGGEASYRLARHRAGDVAALAVLCGFEVDGFPLATQWGYQPIDESWSGLAGIPIRVIHGRDDATVPLSAAEAAVAAMRASGVTVQFDILEHHDHDVWTDTYSDPAFYEWLLGSAVARG
jgi:predicted peptidase